MDLLILGCLILFNSSYCLFKLEEKVKNNKEENENINSWDNIQLFVMLILFIVGLVSTSPELYTLLIHGGSGVVFTTVFPSQNIEGFPTYFEFFGRIILLPLHCCLVGYALWTVYHKFGRENYYVHLVLFDIIASIILICFCVSTWL